MFKPTLTLIYRGAVVNFSIFYPILLFGSVFLCFRLLINRRGESRRKYLERFIEDEHASNFARTQPIPDEMVVTVNAGFLSEPAFVSYPAELPEHTQRTLETLRTNTLDKSSAYMVRLDKGIDNQTLKMTYGVANLERLIAGDDNLYKYLHGLNSYAELLIKCQMGAQARVVLEHAIHDMQSDLAKSQELLSQV